jgi:formate dehydrogenase maturation protein FdhE
MMAVKKNTYINTELDWAEQQLSSWKEYVDANPLHTLEDRIKWKETKAGGAMPMVIASIEAQGKFVQETMKNYLALLEQVDKLREKEEAKKVETRGGAELGSMAEEFLKGRG